MGEVAFDSLTNSYRFQIVEFNGFSFRDLKLETTERRGDTRDKILTVMQNRICIRNNGRLLFGSLQLDPRASENLIRETYNLNVHKFLLLHHYNFEFFTVETAFYLLKTDRKFALFQLLLNVKQTLDALLSKDAGQASPEMRPSAFPQETESLLRDSVVYGFRSTKPETVTGAPEKVGVGFVPARLEGLVNLTQKQFLERNNLDNEHMALERLRQLRDQMDETRASKTLLRTTAEVVMAAEALESERANLDDPARFIFLSLLEDKAQRQAQEGVPPKPKLALTSELVFSAALSEQQEFLMSLLNGGQRPESWDELSAIGAVYWFEGLATLRDILERFWGAEYKNSKDPWRVLFWVVLLGKPKVLAGLFKLQPDSHRFVNFFMEDFSTSAAQTKAVNNAFQLRSKKRFLDSAAFFLLARKYRECFEILLTCVQNLQLVILVFRFFFDEVRQDAEAFAYFNEILRDRFLQNRTGFKDDFLPALGHLILQDFRGVTRQVVDYRLPESVVKDVENFQLTFGFVPTAFPLSIDLIKAFMKKSGRYKGHIEELSPKDAAAPEPTDMFAAPRAVIKAPGYHNDLFLLDDEEEELASLPAPTPTPEPAAAEGPSGERELSRMRFLSSNQKYFLALLEMISLKVQAPERFSAICKENRHFLKHCISEVALKKMSKLIRQQAYAKIEVVRKDTWDLAAYFDVDPLKVFSRISERVRLLNDDSLSLAVLACSRNEGEVAGFVDQLLEKTTRKCFSIIRKGQFILLDAGYWLKKIFYAEDVIGTLRLLSSLPGDAVGSASLATIAWFNEILNALVKLIIIRSMCFDETLEMLEIKGDLPVMCANFGSVLESVAAKVRKMYPFSVRFPTSESEQGRITRISAEGRLAKSGGVQVSEALADDRPENDRQVRELFLRMNQLDVTGKINTVISDLGLNDFYSPSNLCLQLLFEMLYLSGFFFAGDTVKGGNIKKIDYCFESIFYESLKNFILLVSAHELEEALQLLAELQTVTESSNTFLARGAFLHIQPAAALNMSFNRKFVVNEANFKRVGKFLEDLKIFLVLQQDLEALSDSQRKTRTAQFGRGIQVFRPKVDLGVFSQSLFRKLAHSSTPTSEDLYVLLQHRVRKVSLFTSLFKGKRSDEYFSLSHPVP